MSLFPISFRIADKHSLPVRHSMGPLSPKKPMNIPLVSTPTDADYDIITEDAVSWAPVSPERSSTLPSIGKQLSFIPRTPSPVMNKKKGLFRNRSGSFDSHTHISVKKK